MRYTLAMIAALIAQPISAQAPRATYVPVADVERTIQAAPPDQVSDQQIRMIDAGDINLGVGVVHRPVTARLSAILHHDQAEIYHIVSGRGVLVTGERMTDPTPIDADSPTVRLLTGPSATGVDIPGGVSRRVGPGDIVFVPEGLAHGFSEITEAITYIVFRIDPDKLVELK